jgi:cystathionine beta-synthase
MMSTTASEAQTGMQYFNDALEAVGNTPLIKLNKTTDGAKCLVLAKVEYTNPGGSVKDRPAVAMLDAAERAGLLKPGGTIVEPTSGNTGSGLAMAAAIRGYRCILVMPDKMSKEKVDLLRAYGAEVVVTPTNVPNDSPESYYGVANRLASEIAGAFQPNQFHNHHNPEAHYHTTGPEVWKQTDGKITHFVAGIGTGGTISGTARYLKEKNPKIHVVGADPEGSIYSGDTPKSYAVEGIGMSYLPETVDMKVIDEMVRVSDRDSFLMARRITREEGLLVGGSSGTAAVAAFKLAKTLPADAVLVVLFSVRGETPRHGGRRIAKQTPVAAAHHRQRHRCRQECARFAPAIRNFTNSCDAWTRTDRQHKRRNGHAIGIRPSRHHTQTGERGHGPAIPSARSK